MAEIDWRDDFFALGGHSLAAADLAAQVRAEFDVDFTLRDFLGACTVIGVAERIAELRAERATAIALLSRIENISDEEVEHLLEIQSNPGTSI